MNAVEIEEAVTNLAAEPFDTEAFPYAFLEAFGNKKTTIKRLKSGSTNKSDVPGGVLQRSNIHIAVAEEGVVNETLNALRDSPTTKKQKAKYILATDGHELQAEDLTTGETIACAYGDFPDHFGFFLELAGISTVKQIRESAFDIRATSRLNKLYVELLKHNPEWGKADKQHDINHFMARLIFCFFAEDTDIFGKDGLFTSTVGQMSESDASNTHEVIGEIFRAMNTEAKDHEGADIKRWAQDFPYVNGGLFSGVPDVPRFSKIARSYLLQVGSLDWKQINPDIFGSMIQAVADEDERGELGMHYTSVPNILKVLNPLFLDDLREQLKQAGDNPRKLLNLRKRLSRIRVFDPACGSGNFLVIAYKQMREIEAEVNTLREEPDRATEIPLTNFRGIELKSFSAEIARLALIIAEYQSDVLYRGKQLALAEFLPLDAEYWITCGNALRLDWLSLMDVNDTGVKLTGASLFDTPLGQSEIEFENEGGETYICGNPPYKGRNRKSNREKEETAHVFSEYKGSYASLDYVANWVLLAAQYCSKTNASAALVATNSICQGEQVALLWPLIFDRGMHISFAHTSFTWSNLASKKAGVTVVVIGFSSNAKKPHLIYEGSKARQVDFIGPYLVPNSLTLVSKRNRPISQVSQKRWTPSLRQVPYRL